MGCLEWNYLRLETWISFCVNESHRYYLMNNSPDFSVIDNHFYYVLKLFFVIDNHHLSHTRDPRPQARAHVHVHVRMRMNSMRWQTSVDINVAIHPCTHFDQKSWDHTARLCDWRRVVPFHHTAIVHISTGINHSATHSTRAAVQQTLILFPVPQFLVLSYVYSKCSAHLWAKSSCQVASILFWLECLSCFS